MNRSSILLSAVLLSWATLSFGEAVNCVPDSGCKGEDEPPSCCRPPPCEFFYAVMAARAQVRAASGDWLQGLIELDASDPVAAASDYALQLRSWRPARRRSSFRSPRTFGWRSR